MFLRLRVINGALSGFTSLPIIALTKQRSSSAIVPEFPRLDKLKIMTEMLDAAVAKLAALPAAEQDRVAEWLLQELPDEELRDTQFSASQSALSKLAAETRKEKSAGRVTALELDKI